MNSKMDWIKKLDNDELGYLLKNQNKLQKTPENLNREALNLIRNSNEIFNDSKKNDQTFDLKIFFTSYKYALSLAVFILVITSSIFFTVIYSGNRSLLKIEDFSGNINILRKDKSFTFKSKNKIKIGDVLQVEKGSTAKVGFGSNSKISINELSELEILALSKKNGDEITRLSLSKGKIDCEINLPSKESILKIFTDISLFTITGTKFTLESNNDNVELKVDEGKVVVTNNFKELDILEQIKMKDENIYEEINKIIDDEVVVEKNKMITINKTDFKNFKKELNKTLKSFDKFGLIDFKKDGIIDLVKNYSLENKINKLIDKGDENKEELENSENTNTDNEYLSKDNKIILKKLRVNNNISLNDRYTQVTADYENIYLASDNNKTIYCFDPKEGRLKWKFTDNAIKSITTPLKQYKNNLVFATPNSIFVLYRDGSLKEKKDITDGPSYWPSILEENNILLIPAFKSIYQYDGINFSIYKDFSDSFGQLYISMHSGNILYVDINEKIMKEINASTKEILWQYNKFLGRVFMSPLSYKGFIFIGDIEGNLYKINYQSKDKTQEMLKIDSGIISNLITENDKLFFVANDGFFYKIDINDFSEYKKIIVIDKNADKNKYFTKKILLIDKKIFYSSDTGNVFYYDINKDKSEFLEVKENYDNLPLIATPVSIGDKIYFIDTNANIYYLNTNEIK